MGDKLWEGLREGCGTCVFARHVDTGSQVECRRHPPLTTIREVKNPHSTNYVTEYENLRPWMSVSDWCGEYKRMTE